ncbi:MAG: DNA topoisomerase I, partial [Candidatus Bathyarchaeia archaeon]
MKEGYTLIITEKPTAASRIAKALDQNGKPKTLKLGTIPYFLSKNSKNIVVISALGHLYTVTQEGEGRDFYPVFDFKWTPRYEVERSAGKIKDWIDAISKLSEGADDFINSCDYDVEGSLIGYMILKYACGGKEEHAKRMKFSTLTRKEILEAYKNVSPKLDFPLVYAGRTRHEVDWLYGINLSRALTLSAKRWSGKYSTLSTGRVQGPTLKFLYDREREIRSFVPTPYWEVKAKVEVKGKILDVEYERDKILKRDEADRIVNACRGKSGKVIEIETRDFKVPPPTPFDLGTLQTEAYRLFRYTPRRSLDLAERLYLEALISYPRTSSQKLPPAINYREILNGLSQVPAYTKLTSLLLYMDELRPNEGKKDDPAHPAIYPTGNMP